MACCWKHTETPPNTYPRSSRPNFFLKLVNRIVILPGKHFKKVWGRKTCSASIPEYNRRPFTGASRATNTQDRTTTITPAEPTIQKAVLTILQDRIIMYSISPNNTPNAQTPLLPCPQSQHRTRGVLALLGVKRKELIIRDGGEQIKKMPTDGHANQE